MSDLTPSLGETVVTFHTTAFNRTVPKPYFINDCCFGDDLARFLASELTKQGVRIIGEPGQEDFGWYTTFEIAGSKYFFLTSYRPDDITTGATWIGSIERVCSPLARLFGGQNRDINPAATQAIHQALSNSPQIREIRWFGRTDSSY